MDRPIVTIWETYGAGASTIAPALAQRLGVPYVAQALSSADLEARDRAPSLLDKLRGIAVGADAGALVAAESHDTDALRENVRLVREAAEGGVVIVGRNATFLLADHPGAVHVKLDAPLTDRLARAASEHGIGEQEARRRQAREDRMRAELSLSIYNWDPRPVDRYHLVVNTSLWSDAEILDVIVDAVATRVGRRP